MTSNKLGIQVAAECGPDRSIAHLPTARSAFVGRTLRGPVNQPVLIKGFAEFQHVFGGLWQPSLLGYAVEQYFDNGGREAFIVRVVNGARAVTLNLNAGTQVLRLQALRPGTREYLRASVDFDNIAAGEESAFNLTVQRVRAPGTAQVEDQEIFHRLSVLPSDGRYFPRAIGKSALIRLAGTMPKARPERTLDPASGLAIGYVNSNSDGDDGAPLTDYDLIGSSLDHRGVFALDAENFNFLCIPPLSRDKDVGPSALLVAARYCKQRRALLIIDPPAGWQTADEALAALREWNFPDENALMYFPRVLAHDKLRGHFESFAPCGAVAGMLARFDEASPVWLPCVRDEPILRPGLRPACMVGEDKRVKLASLGVNTLQAIRTTGRLSVRPRTLAAGNTANADWRYLSDRRLALFILNCIAHGTRWAAASPPADVADILTAQVRAFFAGLHAAGTFGPRSADDAFFVICDERINSTWTIDSGELNVLIGFAASRENEFHCFRISHSAVLTKVQTVSPNRLNFSQYSPAELEWVETMARSLSEHSA